MTIPYVMTGTSITVILNGVPKTIQKVDSIYEELVDLLENQETNKVKPETIEKKLNVFQKAINTFNKANKTNGRKKKQAFIQVNERNGLLEIHATNGKIYRMSAKLSLDFVNLTRNKKSNIMLKKFLENIAKNPRPDTLDDIFDFLQHNNLFLTLDGCFIAYKYVTEKNGTLYDCYTGKIDNSIGKTVTMPREKVTLDRGKTCSAGLHVGAWDYVKNNNKIVLVKVNPKDVVSVPTDYNGQKMRVCEYTVVDEAQKELDYDTLKTKAYFKK